MDPQTPAKPGEPTPSRSRHPRSTRKKSCQKCAEAKARCNLGKPKCARCAVRDTVCEYPARTESHNVPGTGNQYHHPNPSPLSSAPDALSLDPTWPDGLTRSIVDVSHIQAHSVTAHNGRLLPHSPLPLNFQDIDLAPMIDAQEIRDRWLRPYISDSTGQEPKQLNAHTIQYLTCILKSYLRNILDSITPPFIHPFQQTGIHPPDLAYCFTLVRMWLNRIPGSEPLILGSMRAEMKKIEDQATLRNEFENLCSFQAYLIYFMALHFFPIPATVEQSYPADTQIQINMQEIAFQSAKAGLKCSAEESKARPSWESWIVASAKRRTIFTMYLFTNVYNTQVGLPNYVAEEIREILLPESKVLWQAPNRSVWETEYNRHLSRWEDGMLEISELWKSSETGTDARRERIERWLQSADEFGVMLFGVCAHIHGC